ncbi:MAG TPA: hydrogenase/urease maturation nickel metallochaperone HypA [Oligoflexus sp.]|uniref:hydrogenase/urease maturation nickel metallochaperone HypA n=1 Tax=Oligoflexus sp. TaxID=1971216 RepID=UPI002D7EA28C|nr:hydrogenase/urease maturation nickel metallochaperone HypA [Oligoflexus sp.]HET9240120.1 hydrogenase/urease maturation nickel metallochaperone HypA [Oligoflexus sp.]
MHESGVMKDMMASIQKLRADNRLMKVTRITVRIGALSPFSVDHFREHFFEAAAGSPIEQATLVVETSDDIGADDAQSIVLEEIEGECAG